MGAEKAKADASKAIETAEKSSGAPAVSHTAAKKLAHVAHKAKKKAKVARKAALDAVQKAKANAEKVASDPHASISQIKAAEDKIAAAHHAFRKAKVEQGKADGAKQMQHEMEKQSASKE